MRMTSLLLVSLFLFPLRMALAEQCNQYSLTGTTPVRVWCESGSVTTTDQYQPANCHRAAEARADFEAERLRLSLESTCQNLTCTPENVPFTTGPYIVFGGNGTGNTRTCSATGQYRCECPPLGSIDTVQPQNEGGENFQPDGSEAEQDSAVKTPGLETLHCDEKTPCPQGLECVSGICVAAP